MTGTDCPACLSLWSLAPTAGARLPIDETKYAPFLPLGITVVVVAIAAKAFSYRDNSQVLP
jgi:hypothetical protein